MAAVTGEGAAKKAGKNSKKPKKNGSSGPGDEPAAHGDGTSHGSASEPDDAAPSRQQGEWHYRQDPKVRRSSYIKVARKNPALPTLEFAPI